jgi:hypothetical protein
VSASAKVHVGISKQAKKGGVVRYEQLESFDCHRHSFFSRQVIGRVVKHVPQVLAQSMPRRGAVSVSVAKLHSRFGITLNLVCLVVISMFGRRREKSSDAASSHAENHSMNPIKGFDRFDASRKLMAHFCLFQTALGKAEKEVKHLRVGIPKTDLDVVIGRIGSQPRKNRGSAS